MGWGAVENREIETKTVLGIVGLGVGFFISKSNVQGLS